MSVTADMARMWRRPAAVVRGLLAAGKREDRALAFLLAGCLLVFVGRLPVIQRAAVLNGGDFVRDASYSFFALMMLAPLIFYGIAALGWGLARLAGQGTTAYGGRLALFWAYLASAPAGLLYGLALGFTGPGPAVTIVGVVWLGALLVFWAVGLRVSGQEASHA